MIWYFSLKPLCDIWVIIILIRYMYMWLFWNKHSWLYNLYQLIAGEEIYVQSLKYQLSITFSFEEDAWTKCSWKWNNRNFLRLKVINLIWKCDNIKRSWCLIKFYLNWLKKKRSKIKKKKKSKSPCKSRSDSSVNVRTPRRKHYSLLTAWDLKKKSWKWY